MYLFSILFALYLHANYKASRNLISNHLILCKQINLLEMENPAVLVQYTNKWRRKLSKSVRSLVVKACDRVRVVCGKHGVAWHHKRFSDAYQFVFFQTYQQISKENYSFI